MKRLLSVIVFNFVAFYSFNVAAILLYAVNDGAEVKNVTVRLTIQGFHGEPLLEEEMKSDTVMSQKGLYKDIDISKLPSAFLKNSIIANVEANGETLKAIYPHSVTASQIKGLRINFNFASKEIKVFPTQAANAAIPVVEPAS